MVATLAASLMLLPFGVRYGASEPGRCSCSTTRSLTYSRPTSSSSMLRCWIFALLTASARIASAPIAPAPIAVTPTAKAPRPMAPIARPKTACVPDEERFGRLMVTLLATRVFVRICTAFSLSPDRYGTCGEHDAIPKPPARTAENTPARARIA